MIYYQDIDKLIFEKHNSIDCDEMIIVSGYLGPNPIEKLENLPVPVKVIYGMYSSDGISPKLHKVFLDLNNKIANINIKYSKFPVHSKCYIWLKNGLIVHSLIGSANFTRNGLMTSYREILSETKATAFEHLKIYVDQIDVEAIECNTIVRPKYKQWSRKAETSVELVSSVCKLSLLDASLGMVPEKSGLNWGLSKLTGSHTNIDDAYIPILKKDIELFPSLFPPKTIIPRETVETGRRHRNNEPIEILWDDGTRMSGLLEGTQGSLIKYPKQVASHPQKRILGQYFRKRLKVKSGKPITTADLDRYGRRDVEISLLGEGIYYFDFSKPKKPRK